MLVTTKTSTMGTPCVGDLGGCLVVTNTRGSPGGCLVVTLVDVWWSPTQGVPPEKDDNYDKLEFVQPQEEILMSTLQFGNPFLLVIHSILH